MNSNNSFLNWFQNNAYNNISNINITSNLLYLDHYNISNFVINFNQIINHTEPSIIIELGSFNGLTACIMAEEIKKHNISCKIICIDTWQYSQDFWSKISNYNINNIDIINNSYPQIYNIFINNIIIENHTDIIIPIYMPPDRAIEILNYNNMKADIIFINCELENNIIKNNINEYWNILNNNGIIFGNNYLIDNKTYINLNDFINTSNLLLNIENDIWSIKK
jgi:hypothetical protein